MDQFRAGVLADLVAQCLAFGTASGVDPYLDQFVVQVLRQGLPRTSAGTAGMSPDWPTMTTGFRSWASPLRRRFCFSVASNSGPRFFTEYLITLQNAQEQK